MSTQSAKNGSSNMEAKCPDCEMTLSRKADLKRHRNSQHPDGTEVRVPCPFSGCQFKAYQRSNLNAHINARHSTVSRILCPTCSKGFADPAARIRHRKKIHGYQPYHTPHYLAKRALKEAEQKRVMPALSKSRDQEAASIAPSSTQNTSSSTDNLSDSLYNATYHNDFWELLVDAPRCGASEIKVSQDVQISVPVSVAPAHDAPHVLQSNSALYLPDVGQQPSTTQKSDGTFLLVPPLGATMQPQSQTLAPSWVAHGQNPGVTSDYLTFATTFPASGRQSPCTSMGFPSLPTFSFPSVSSAMSNPFNFPTSSSCVPGKQFVFPKHIATPSPIQPVPALSWTPSLSPVDSTPLSQAEFFTDEAKGGFNTWVEFASEL